MEPTSGAPPAVPTPSRTGALTAETGPSYTLTLRLRGAGGKDLPEQKQEGLGGWTALRGYDFKEFRGNASLLAHVSTLPTRAGRQISHAARGTPPILGARRSSPRFPLETQGSAESDR